MSSGFLGWTPKDSAQQLQNLARRTTFVAFSKYALIVLAVVLVLLVFVIPAMQDSSGGARIVFSNIREGEVGKPHMSNPRFQGLDARNQPYELAASMAEQQPDGSILLKDLEASVTLANGRWMMFTGDNGIYHREDETLHLPGAVQGFYDEGYELNARNVHIDLKAATASSAEEVRSHGPLGKLKSDGFSVDNTRRIMLFEPNVKVTLYPGTTLHEMGND